MDPLALNPLRALDALALNARTFCSLNALALDARPFSPLYALPFQPWALRALNPLPFEPRFRTLDALTLDSGSLGTLRAFGPLALGTLWPLGLALALAGLCTLTAIAAVALGVCRGGERDAGDAGDQEKLATHDVTRSIKPLAYQRTNLGDGPVPDMNGAVIWLIWPLQEGGSALGNLGFILAGALSGVRAFLLAALRTERPHGKARGVQHPNL